MKIAVDIDEVLAHLVNPLLAFHNENYGTNHSREDALSYSLTDLWQCSPEEKMRRVMHFIEEGHFARLHPTDGSQEAIEQLAETHTLIALTSRFTFLQETTESWLEQHFPGAFSKVVSTNQYGTGTSTTKGAVCVQEGVDMLIEDDIENMLDVAQQNIPVLLVDHPWNKTDNLPQNVTRVHSWDDILTKINP